MPHIDILAEVAARDPEVVLIERLPSEMPADVHNADQSAGRTGRAVDDAEPDEQASHVDNGGWGAGAPARSVRRATARRASTRRATARSRQDDSETRVIDFLAQHPGSRWWHRQRPEPRSRKRVKPSDPTREGRRDQEDGTRLLHAAGGATALTPAPTLSRVLSRSGLDNGRHRHDAAANSSTAPGWGPVHAITLTSAPRPPVAAWQGPLPLSDISPSFDSCTLPRFPSGPTAQDANSRRSDRSVVRRHATRARDALCRRRNGCAQQSRLSHGLLGVAAFGGRRNSGLRG